MERPVSDQATLDFHLLLWVLFANALSGRLRVLYTTISPVGPVDANLSSFTLFSSVFL